MPRFRWVDRAVAQQNTMKEASHEIELQRGHFARVSSEYDSILAHEFEHAFALCFLVSMIDHFKFVSVLDVGSGTGRAICYVKQKSPDTRIQGIEPVKELREIAFGKGISPEQLTDGDATQLPFADNAFDLVCGFGVLHHIRNSSKAVDEMLRVAKKGIFISDGNNFGQGSLVSRTVKQAINSIGLWKAADLIKTRGKGYRFSEGDGVSYSYSVFNNYNQIRRACQRIHVINTSDTGFAINPYRTASHVAVLGILKS